MAYRYAFFILARMSRYYSYLNSAAQVLQQYGGNEPLASFLKKFFAASRKYGSRDRKHIAHLCYCFFRLGKSGYGIPVSDRILISLFLCTFERSEILGELRPAWNEKTDLSVNDKISLVAAEYSLLTPFSVSKVFPWEEELSAIIDHKALCESFFRQPDLFLRLRPGKEETVKKKLTTAGLEFRSISSHCLAMPNTSKVDAAIDVNIEAVVQDMNSQRVGELMYPLASGMRVWDCCAASGGKSLMAFDLFPGIKLTVSDIRQSIITNLKKRFAEAGINEYEQLVIDLSNDKVRNDRLNRGFSMVIADVPCSGSGTWGRTPEQLYYFEEQKITAYAALQKKIVSNVIPFILENGYLLYITCSVFRKENEEVAGYIEDHLSLSLVTQQIYQGYDKKADTLFAALFVKKTTV